MVENNFKKESERELKEKGIVSLLCRYKLKFSAKRVIPQESKNS